MGLFYLKVCKNTSAFCVRKREKKTIVFFYHSSPQYRRLQLDSPDIRVAADEGFEGTR